MARPGPKQTSLKFQAIEMLYKKYPNEWIPNSILNKITGCREISARVKKSDLIVLRSADRFCKTKGTLKDLYLSCISNRCKEIYPSYLQFYNVLRIIRLCEPINTGDLRFLLGKENLITKVVHDKSYFFRALNRLEEDNYIEFTKKDKEKRKTIMTKEGLKILKKVDEVIYKCE